MALPVDELGEDGLGRQGQVARDRESDVRHAVTLARCGRVGISRVRILPGKTTPDRLVVSAEGIP